MLSIKSSAVQFHFNSIAFRSLGRRRHWKISNVAGPPDDPFPYEKSGSQFGNVTRRPNRHRQGNPDNADFERLRGSQRVVHRAEDRVLPRLHPRQLDALSRCSELPSAA
jgi:hypothetical protein